MAKYGTDWEKRMELALKGGPYLGHPMLPIPLRGEEARTERVSSYVELDFLKFMEEYKARGGFRSVSEVLRRLAILGAMTEGYELQEAS
jgi:hypothetical protein